MTTQTKNHTWGLSNLPDEIKCYICGLIATHEIKEFDMGFCEKHWIELRYKILDWARKEDSCV